MELWGWTSADLAGRRVGESGLPMIATAPAAAGSEPEYLGRGFESLPATTLTLSDPETWVTERT
jgi:hypothetical protein